MKVLVTGSAGFIGAAVTQRLLARGDTVIGLDNHNDYYDPALKEARLAQFVDHPAYTHYRMDLADRAGMDALFAQHRPQRVVNLGAQAGVRYSIDNPLAYIDSNIVGFAHILEGCRHYGCEHLVYASSSSVYGANTDMPFSTAQSVEHPLSAYAASKKSNELMAHVYSNLFAIPTTGLRFFTVYGPWGRPDMALFKFTQKIMKGETIDVYGYGHHQRDYTYIDDIVEGIMRVLDKPASPNPNWDGKHPDSASSSAPWRVYNIGNQQPVVLLDYIHALENAIGQKANMNLLPAQPGDLPDTYADSSALMQDFGYHPSTTVQEGINRFVAWYKDFYRS